VGIEQSLTIAGTGGAEVPAAKRPFATARSGRTQLDRRSAAGGQGETIEPSQYFPESDFDGSKSRDMSQNALK
jgi:hypothetical protein